MAITEPYVPTEIARSLHPVPRPDGGFLRDRCFAWVHRPATPNGTALVIVPPFGYEAICAHRSLHYLADAAARAGMLAVRIDLDGTGDSAGTDLDPDRLAAWLATIDDACDHARTAGADRLVLAGVRLGATLATLAAATRADVTGLVAIAAVPQGKALVREGRALQLALGLAPAPPGASRDVHEVAGFALTEDTAVALAKIDLIAADRAPAPSVLVVDRIDLAPNDTWVASLRRLGAEVSHERLHGYVEMMLDPHRAEIPRTIVDATVGFAATRRTHAIANRRPAVELASTIAIEGATEQLIRIDDRLVAIASSCTPSPSRAVILLNAGATHRIGPNRLYVELARVLAARGMLALRLDQSGLGDSPARAGADDNVVYGEHAVTDIGAAIAWVRARGATHVTLIGLCSGAYHGLRAAVTGHAIDEVIAINPLTYHWKPGMPLDFAAFRVTTDARRYQRSVRSTESWRKLLRGDVDVSRVARVVGKRIRAAVEHAVRDVLRRLDIRLPDDLGCDLRDLGRRGVAMHFVFAAEDPGHDMLVEQGGSVVARLIRAEALSIDVIADADHTFTPRWSHPVLIETILRVLR